jgi:hypothetical protein
MDLEPSVDQPPGQIHSEPFHQHHPLPAGGGGSHLPSLSLSPGTLCPGPGVQLGLSHHSPPHFVRSTVFFQWFPPLSQYSNSTLIRYGSCVALALPIASPLVSDGTPAGKRTGHSRPALTCRWVPGSARVGRCLQPYPN